MKTKPTLVGLAITVDDLATRLDELMSTLQVFATNVDQRFVAIEQRLDRVETTMATKSYVDYKLADLKGDILAMFKQHPHT